IAGLFFALKDVYSKKAMEKKGLEQALFYIYFLAWIPVALYFLLFDYQVFSASDLQLGAFVGLGLAIGYFLFFKAMESGKISLAGPVSELWVLFTVIAAFFVLGEKISFVRIIGLALSFVALFVLSGKRKTGSKSIFYALAAAIVWGFSWFMVKPLVDSVGTVGAYVLYVGVGVVLFFLYSVFSKKLAKPSETFLIPALLLLLAYLVEVWGVGLSTVSLVSIAYSPAYILSVIVLTRVLLGEKLKKIHYVGIALILIAITLIALG
ncbi:MAG: DMT family transporter, partial [Candidatus Micrarchaeota archaeon]